MISFIAIQAARADPADVLSLFDRNCRSTLTRGGDRGGDAFGSATVEEGVDANWFDSFGLLSSEGQAEERKGKDEAKTQLY